MANLLETVQACWVSFTEQDHSTTTGNPPVLFLLGLGMVCVPTGLSRGLNLSPKIRKWPINTGRCSTVLARDASQHSGMLVRTERKMFFKKFWLGGREAGELERRRRWETTDLLNVKINKHPLNWRIHFLLCKSRCTRIYLKTLKHRYLDNIIHNNQEVETAQREAIDRGTICGLVFGL